MTKAWRVYLARCADGTLYCGVSTDVPRRVRQHNGEIAGGARYTRARRPVTLAWVGPAWGYQGDALAQERYVKGLQKHEKEAMADRWSAQQARPGVFSARLPA